MIFKQVQQVLDGTKVQTRRPVKEDEYGVRLHGCDYSSFRSVVLRESYRTKWAVGRTYAVQPGRGKKAMGRIRITKIRREKLQDITRRVKDVQAEMGYLVSARAFMWGRRTWFHFRDLWNSIYSKPYRWEDNPEVWVLDFERSEG